ncbi:hypothetical protein [Desulforhopalus sp. 52FAK]
MNATLLLRLNRPRCLHRFIYFNQRRAVVVFLLGISSLVLFCPGCTQLYTGFQAVGEQSCHGLSYPEQQDCIEQVNLSYEEYEDERERSTQL